MFKTTLLQAIKAAGKLAANATYNGRVVIETYDCSTFIISEHTDNSYIQFARELYSFDTSPYEKESAAALVRIARAELGV